jgi:hypothetical protein
LNYRDQIRFQKNKTDLGFMFWTVGYNTQNHRDSLAKCTGEAVSSIFGRWIQFERLKSNPAQSEKPRRPSTVAPWRRHGWTRPELTSVFKIGDFGHQTTHGQCKSKEKLGANSPA